MKLYAHATNTRACEVFGHRFYFDAFSTVHANTHIYAFSLSNRCVCDENALRVSADGRPKHFEMCAFSNKNALVWTRPKSPRVFHIAFLTFSLPFAFLFGTLC